MRRLLLAVVGGLVGLLVVEAGLRLAVSSGWPVPLADPARYASSLSDDAYWILRAKGGLQPALRRHTKWEQDAVLGWTPDRRNLNRMGGWQSPLARDRADRVIAVFGDSFVFGTVPDGQRLPDQLQVLAPDAQVLNYGVGGYGLDQTLLRLERRLPDLAGAEIVIGVLTTDLDRCLLSVRSGPKPRFRLGADGLVLDDEGLGTEHAAWFRQQRGPVSLLQALARQALRPVDAHRKQVEALVPQLFARLRQACQDRSCRVVVFEGPEEVVKPLGWRAALILDQMGLPVLLARDALGASPLDAYGVDRHLNAEGNRLVAGPLVRAAAQEGPARRPTGRVPVAEEGAVGDHSL